MGYLSELQQMERDNLINQIYNDRVGEWTDYSDKEMDKRGHGKRIPYIGWFWRFPDFVRKRISIGDCGDFIGVMENNKWGYAERDMTEEEATTFIDYLDRAFAELSRGGNVAELHANAEKVFDELWDWFQTLPLEYYPPDY